MKFHCSLKIISLLFSVAGMPLIAEVAERPVDAKAWFDKLDKKQLATLKIPHKVAIVQSFGSGGAKTGLPKFFQFPDRKCLEISFFDCARSADSQFGVSINDPTKVGGVVGVNRLTDADVVAYGEGANLKVAAGAASGSTEFDFGDLKGGNWSALLEGVFSALGYDGVVLDNNHGGYILVGAVQSRFKSDGLQALSIGKSSDKLILTNANRKGAALLSMVSSSGPLAVFQIVNLASDGSDVEPGAKIILEESK
jgi:hypothetical protein